MRRETGKPIVWLRGEVKTPPFSEEARIEAGYLLRLLQRGESLSLPHSRPMPAIGPRCHELRINDPAGTFRIMYRADSDAVIILDAFIKKTRQTPTSVIEACTRRLQRLRPPDRRIGDGAMKKSKRAKLEAAGWAVGSVQEFLGLSDAEAALIEMKLSLSRSLRDRRQRRGISQVELAKRLRSSQSRVAKMEAGDPSVSMDLLVSSLLVLGASAADLARVIRNGEGSKSRHAAA